MLEQKNGAALSSVGVVGRKGSLATDFSLHLTS